MNATIDIFMILLILTDLALLGTSRLQRGVRIAALQGLLVGMLPLLHGTDSSLTTAILLSAANVAVKSVLFPWLMDRIMRDMPVRREVRPYMGYGMSAALGVLALGGSVWISHRLLPDAESSPANMMPAALFSMFTGLVLIITRRQAITQVLGYLVMENGIFTAGMLLVPGSPVLVELGVLLDFFVGVFLMGIMVFHIHREFDHIDTDRLNELGDWRNEGSQS